MAMLIQHPAQHPQSTGELLMLAQGLERRAAARYRTLAETMRQRGEGELARLFAFLAGIEDKHLSQVAARASVPAAVEPPLSMFGTGLPEAFDEEVAGSATLTPYRALALAVRSEESSFAFYSYIAAGATSPAVRKLAEELAKDELEHAALLRRKRRRAYRAERAARPPETLPETVAELRALAARHAAMAAEIHRALATSLSAQGQSVAAEAFLAAAVDEEQEATDLSRSARPQMPVVGERALPTVTTGLRLLEEAFDRYTAIVEHANDEAVLDESQRLSERALRRLAMTRGRLAAAKPRN